MADIEVHFWAAARAAAGVAEQFVPVSGDLSVAQLVSRLSAERADGRLGAVLAICAVLVDDQPLGRRDPATVLLRPGARVEFLPPFAGG